VNTENVVSRLVSPNAFDGRGPVPEKVRSAAKRIAKLRTKFLLQDEISHGETEELFRAAALQAEWMRELYEVVHDDISRRYTEQTAEHADWCSDEHEGKCLDRLIARRAGAGRDG
jgi:hypothetical protein